MSHITNLHHYLDSTCDWNIKELETIITQNPSSVNEVINDPPTMTPLIKVLASKNCAANIVKLLLDHGADINLKNCSPLMIALDGHADDQVIAMLLDKGARVDVCDNFYSLSLLCTAFRNKASKYVIEMLLDAGCSIHTCNRHASLMLCFCASLQFTLGIREDILRLICKAGPELHMLESDGQSSMCLALSSGAGPNDIQLLTRVGVSVNACEVHPSSFHCLIEASCEGGNVFAGDTVKALLDAGACFDTVVEDGSTLLHDILRECKYECEAIRLLLDIPGLNVHGLDVNGGTLLHCAVCNVFCQLSVLKLLLNKGVEVGEFDGLNKETALDLAILGNQSLTVINFLLEKGSPINSRYHATSFPLVLAAKHCNKVVMSLLIAGARIGTEMDLTLINAKLTTYLLEPEIYQDYIPEHLNIIKCLVKCYILEGSKFPIVNCTSDPIILDELLDFEEKCTLELGQMESESIGHARTLHQLISRKSPPRTLVPSCMEEGKDFDFDRLLETLSGTNAFPLYFDIISANVGKKPMEKKLQDVPVYIVVDSFDSPCTSKKVTLHYDVVCKIAGLLSDSELLNLILAFDKPKNHASSKRGSEDQNVVEPGPSYFQKRQRLG